MIRSGRCLLGACLALGAACAAPAWSAPFNFQTAAGRLPKDVRPLSYSIAVVPDLDAATLRGNERVTLDVRIATRRIVFNTLNITLSDVRVDNLPVASVTTDNEAQLSTVTLAQPLSIGRHELSLSYTGRIEHVAAGLFLQSFRTTRQTQERLLSTQMEATDARRMFPCWDEPAFRAVWELTVKLPADWVAVGNMPVASSATHGSTTTTTFQPTPSMPSYLVELTAGDLASVGAVVGATQVHAWATRGEEQRAVQALADATQVLGDYNQYFGLAYPLPKLDLLAIPGGFEGAMENWGAITFNDQLMLLDKGSSLSSRQEVFSTAAHEIAHQWFGNLVTMGWWDDLWLNESFASWMAARETDRRHPEWKWWEAEDASREEALEADARSSGVPLRQPVTDERQATQAFDPDITYSKGEAVLRMLESWMGEDSFRQGIHRYLQAHQYGNANTADLWAALDATGRGRVSEVAQSWVEQPGFPLVMATSHCDPGHHRTVVLTQQRFLASTVASNGTASPLRWQIPMRVRVGGAGSAPRALLFKQDGHSLPAGMCDEPLVLDADALGYYRVQYDDATFRTNKEAFYTLPDADRIGLLDDEWALFLAGRTSLRRYLKLAAAMGSNVDQRQWEQVTGAMSLLESSQRGRARYASTTAYTRGLIAPLASRLGWDAAPNEAPGVATLRQKVLSDLGEWGDQATIDESRRRFSAYVRQTDNVPSDTHLAMMNVVATHADAATFEQLHQLALHARGDGARARYLTLLMGVRDPALAERAAEIALSDEIPPQQNDLRFRLLATLAGWHPELAWKQLQAHVDKVLAPGAPFRDLMIAQYVPQEFWAGADPAVLERWVRSQVPAAMSVAVERGMESARLRRAQRDLLVQAADSTLPKGG